MDSILSCEYLIVDLHGINLKQKKHAQLNITENSIIIYIITNTQSKLSKLKKHTYQQSNESVHNY